ncbi:unnamed protein product [Lactuca virosa]|uniref:Uncharacterized protein n=1 Tax=Lactuca virosa TaxID=75947 RepID=A0AAU9MCS6_9ASTR|nr:unnamed protein product [Lactuca virosa]
MELPPALIEKLKEDIKLKTMKVEVYDSDCLQVGYLKYAGNLTKKSVKWEKCLGMSIIMLPYVVWLICLTNISRSVRSGRVEWVFGLSRMMFWSLNILTYWGCCILM